jgi:hypothetical protein
LKVSCALLEGDLVGSTDINRLVAFKELAELLSEFKAAVIAQRKVLEILREGAAGKKMT